MPFGIIDTRDDAPLAGTEYLIKDDSASSQQDVDASHLKRVLYKVSVIRPGTVPAFQLTGDVP
jgi:hypothetical protein